MITRFEDLDLSKSYTYLDYVSWRFNERVELIKGKIFKMSPTPSRAHQGISRNILIDLGLFLRNKKCEVYDAPFDVILSKGEKSTVVQADICVICDQAKLDDKGCNGAPDIIIEILSPGNSRKEMKDKFELYEENHVRQYWIVNPLEETIIIYTLHKGKYFGSKPYVVGDILETEIIEGFKLELQNVFHY